MCLPKVSLTPYWSLSSTAVAPVYKILLYSYIHTCTQHIVQYNTVQCTKCTVQCTKCTVQCTKCTVHCTVYMYSVHSQFLRPWENNLHKYSKSIERWPTNFILKKNFSGELNKRNNLADKLVKFSKFEIVWALASLAKLRSYQNFRK